MSESDSNTETEAIVFSASVKRMAHANSCKVHPFEYEDDEEDMDAGAGAGGGGGGGDSTPLSIHPQGEKNTLAPPPPLASRNTSMPMIVKRKAMIKKTKIVMTGSIVKKLDAKMKMKRGM
jgi:hypothetical protein